MGSAAALAGATLLGGVLLWEVALRSQMGVSISFLEEMWSRNLGHVFVSPLRPWELVAALIGMSMIRMLVGVLPAILLAWLLYAFNLFALGPVLVLFFVNLMIMGWAVALGVVVADPAPRRGRGGAGLVGAVRADAVLGGVLPGLRAARGAAADRAGAAVGACVRGHARRPAGRRRALGSSGAAFALNAVWLAGAALLFARQFHQARVRGALAEHRRMNDRDPLLADPPRPGGGERARHAVRRDGRGAVRDDPAGAGADVPRAGRRLPRPAAWKVTPLSRTRRTAEAIFAAGYPAREPGGRAGPDRAGLGEWQGLPHAELPARLALPAHAFWPLAGDERPPGGESMAEVIERVGAALERLAEHACRARMW